jgi:ribose 5-phosphate isomerase B
MKLAIGSDHAGFELKEELFSYLKSKQHELSDKGAYSTERADYPDFGHAVATAVTSGEVTFGILMCGSGNGINMAANKHQGIRAAICWGEELAELARKHNDANIICIPSRFVREGDAERMVQIFMTTEFEGGRHSNRVQKIACN